MADLKTNDPPVEGAPPSASGDAALQAEVYSKDYWDIVFEQLGRRALFKVGLSVLAVLYALAIFAPLIANDRPYVIEAVDLRAYKSASGSLRAVARELGVLIEMSDEDYSARVRERMSVGAEAEGSAEPDRSRNDAIQQEKSAALDRLDVIRRYLPDEPEGLTESEAENLEQRKVELDEYEGLIRGTVTAYEQGNNAEAVTRSAAAQDLGRGFRRGLAAWDPAKPDKGGIKLRGAKSYPLWQSLSLLEIFFMGLMVLTLTWPVWNRLVNGIGLGGDRESIRRWRRRKLLGVLALSGLACVLWTLTPLHGEAATYDAAPFKGDLTEGTLVLVKAGAQIGSEGATSRPVWPPVAYGFAEQHREEDLRPPTWRWNADIDEDGYYERGARAPEGEGDATGVRAQETPIVVLEHEPARNAPLRRLAGTDSTGRDFLTRMLWGGRISLTVGILSALLLTIIGVVMGSLAGYFGGWVDTAIMRVIEIIQSMPAFFLILAAMAFTDPKVVHPIFTIVIVIALIRWTGTARLVRGEFLRLREAEFVLAAQALGFSNRRTIFRHVLPNAMGPVLVAAAFSVAAGILTESAISFLGMGTREPDASWGSLVNDTKNPDYWWVQVFPGILIFITVTCYNLVGDAVRDALDPKMKL